MARRYALRDGQWERIEGLLPGREDRVGVTARDNRLFVEAVLYRYRAGIPWRGFAGTIWRMEGRSPAVYALVGERRVGNSLHTSGRRRR